MKAHGIDKFYIEMLEEYPCENVEQLRKKEGECIRQYGTLNMKIEGRTLKQYYIDHKEKYSARDKLWRATHAEEKKSMSKLNYERHKEYFTTKIDCPCGGCYTNKNRASHFKTNRHQQYLNNPS